MNNLEEITELLKNSSNVKSSEVLPTTQKEEKLNLINSGLELWNKKGRAYSNFFEKGEIISNYTGLSEHDYLTFLLSTTRLLEEIIKEELLKRECDTTEIKEAFNLIKSSYKTLSIILESNLKNKDNKEQSTPLDINIFFSAFHGFISSYVQKNLDK
jgi:hypothetical protein